MRGSSRARRDPREHCANAVTAELTSLDGVTGVTVTVVPDGISQVSVTRDAPLPDAGVTAALEAAGDYRIVSP